MNSKVALIEEEWDWLGDPFGRVQTLLMLLVVGLGFLVMVLFSPDGVMGIVDRIRRSVRRNGSA